MAKDGIIPGFKSKIEKILIKDIDINTDNPRKKFGQEAEDELIESISIKGVLQPLIVFEKDHTGKYELLDGQRRFQACKKIGIEKIPAHILEKKPNFIEKISIMFHLHNVHEDWTDLAIAKTLQRILVEKNVKNRSPTQEELKDIKKLTSLSFYKIKKYLDFLKFSNIVLDKFIESELKENPDLDVDLLSELIRPLKKIQKIMPGLIKDFPEEKFVDVFIQKKKNKIIKTNKEIREFSKILTNAQKSKMNLKIAEEKIYQFLSQPDITIEQIYSETSEAIEQQKTIMKMSVRLKREVNNIDFRKISKEDLNNLIKELKDLIASIKNKIKF